MAGKKIESGQTGLEVRNILNSTIEEVEKVSEEVSSTIPISNADIEEILKR